MSVPAPNNDLNGLPGSSRDRTDSTAPLANSNDARDIMQTQASLIAEQRAAEQQEMALRASEERYRTLFEAIDVGFCVIEMLFDEQGRAVDYRFLESNPAFERHTGLINAIGKTAVELVPDLDVFWFRTYGNVALTGDSIRFENHAPAMGRWFDVYAMRVGSAEEHKVVILFTDITTRKEAQEALRESEEQLRDAQTRLEAALSAGEIATWTFDVVNDRVVADANLARLFSVDPEAAQGGRLSVYLDNIFSGDRDRVMEAIREAIASQEHFEAEYRVVLPDGSHRWLVARGKIERDESGKAVSLPGVALDITERVERERRERFLIDLMARTRGLLIPEDILYETTKLVGEYTSAHRCLYIEIDGSRDTLTVRREYLQEGIPSMAGTHPLSAFGPPIVESLREGNITQSNDIEEDPRLTPENRVTFRALKFRSFLSIPLHRAGRWVAVLAVHYEQARVWTQEEAELLTTVVERTWLAVENAHLFRETQRRTEWEALLNQIGAAVRSTLDPEAITEAAVSALGPGLEADRCYFVRYNQTRDHGTVFPEWLRPGVDQKTLVGLTRPMSRFSVNRDAAFKAGRRQVVNDTMAYSPEDAAPLLALDVRALMRLPIEIGDQMTAIGVAMAHTPRQWTEEEVQLVENVGTIVRSALESAHVQQRERNIAQQLQAALLPPAPDNLPGLALASHYSPALAEAGVGGDFFDVFSVNEGCTALVVADLAGKGLQAASQVATVRNMLRFALYKGITTAEAVIETHNILVKHDLLTGFATLFVGLFDHEQRTLTYVNCGQEPGLVLRVASREIERLEPTGPVLGGFGPGSYEQQTVHLFEGDIIALFTDGLTEIGPNRTALLEVDGVINLLRSVPRTDDPHAIVKQIIASVDAYAGGGVRDDIALLVGVVTPI